MSKIDPEEIKRLLAREQTHIAANEFAIQELAIFYRNPPTFELRAFVFNEKGIYIDNLIEIYGKHLPDKYRSSLPAGMASLSPQERTLRLVLLTMVQEALKRN